MAENPELDLDVQRKKLRFRAWHRGIREMDLILGRFADERLLQLSRGQLDQFAALLNAPDLDVYHWIIGTEPVPAEYDNEIMALLRDSDHVVPGVKFDK